MIWLIGLVIWLLIGTVIASWFSLNECPEKNEEDDNVHCYSKI